MFDKIFKALSIIVIIAAIGVFTYIGPLVKKDVSALANNNRSSIVKHATEDKYQIINNPTPADVVFMATMLCGCVAVSYGATVFFKDYCDIL